MFTSVFLAAKHNIHTHTKECQKPTQSSHKQLNYINPQPPDQHINTIFILHQISTKKKKCNSHKEIEPDSLGSSSNLRASALTYVVEAKEREAQNPDEL